MSNIYPQEPGELFVVNTERIDGYTPGVIYMFVYDKLKTFKRYETIPLKSNTTLLYVGKHDIELVPINMFLTSCGNEVFILTKDSSHVFHPLTGYLKKVRIPSS